MRAVSICDLPAASIRPASASREPTSAWGATDVRPALLGGFHAGDGALFDDLALELGDRTQDVIQEPPGSRRGIEPFGQRSQEDAPIAQHSGDLDGLDDFRYRGADVALRIRAHVFLQVS
jgi:hypothetical protein